MVKHVLNDLNLYRPWVVFVCLLYSLYATIYCSMPIRSGENSSGHRCRLLCLFLSHSSLNFFFIFYICPSTFVLFAAHLKFFFISLYFFFRFRLLSNSSSYLAFHCPSFFACLPLPLAFVALFRHKNKFLLSNKKKCLHLENKSFYIN